MKSRHFSRDFEVLSLGVAWADTEKMLIGVAIRFNPPEETPEE